MPKFDPIMMHSLRRPVFLSLCFCTFWLSNTECSGQITQCSSSGSCSAGERPESSQLNSSLSRSGGQAKARNGLEFDPVEVLDEVAALVADHFYDPKLNQKDWAERVAEVRNHIADVDDLDSFSNQVNQLLAGLDASHTFYFSKHDPKRYQLLGVFGALFEDRGAPFFQYEGIGVETKLIDGRYVIQSVYDGTPAKQAGLRFGDVVLSVNGMPYHPIRSFVGKSKSASRPNSKCVMEIERCGDVLTVQVVPTVFDGRNMFESALEASINVVEREGAMIGYVHVWSYAGRKYHDLVEQALLFGKLSQCDGVVIDLRDGWGGASLDYLSLFQEPIAKVGSVDRNGNKMSFSGRWEKPVALLTNQRSTSGKELLVYGFKKLGLGTVVGEPTAGAVLAGRCFLLSNDDVLYLAVRDVLVDGKRLEGKGVQPDRLVPRPFKLENSNAEDPQLEAAIREMVRQHQSIKAGNR